MSDSSFIYSLNADFIEQLYEKYLSSPASISSDWRRYFDSLQNGADHQEIPHSRIHAEIISRVRCTRKVSAEYSPVQFDTRLNKQVSVLQLINAYRFRGHRVADLDPLHQYARPTVDELHPEYHDLYESDMDSKFNTGSLFGPDTASLREILRIVKTTYCRSIGAEYMFINDTEQKRWIQQRLESCLATPEFSKDKKKRILERLIAATTLEEYLGTKYVGQKRFSLEGSESLIPLLDCIIQKSGVQGSEEVVIGMAHRGRLNVLVNTVGKLPRDLFDEFEGKKKLETESEEMSSGDVKYHLGYSSDISTPGNPIHLTLAFNPSHLEIINPVVEGAVRARQQRHNDKEHNKVIPVLIHGDAAFAGQGVVMETFNLSQTHGYKTGGTVHIIVNNQIGFTTSDPLDSRSTLYCTDVAKMVQAPIFHVNANDPEAAVFITELALDYRMQFNKDVVIDLIGYRKHGHSEADEPSATQPIMYQKIRQESPISMLYRDTLIQRGDITEDQAFHLQEDYINALESNKPVAGNKIDVIDNRFAISYQPYRKTPWHIPTNTSMDYDSIKELAGVLNTLPDNFEVHPAVEKIIQNRKKMANNEMKMDWGFAENLAYASLLKQGYDVRISGQDSARGTFFHRHSVMHDMNDGNTYVPLRHISKDQGDFLVINSTLSEEAVLAYEYGYSTAEPEALVIWEAQFGDFANGAQVVIDQFISSCEAKWGRFCGLTLLLPHGYDGQGPEHSSARLERYLQLCAQQNIQVCVPSNASQIFHLLRRQMLRPYRKPLIVISPKSLLRDPLARSPLEKLNQGTFKLVIDDIDEVKPADVTRLIFCCGKVFYEALKQRRENNLNNIAIVRIEQLFPFPANEVRAIVQKYSNCKEIVWLQEEPKNQGSWYYMQSRRTMIGCIRDDQEFGYAGRTYSASPAVGHAGQHKEQQEQLIADALELDKLEITHRKTIYKN